MEPQERILASAKELFFKYGIKTITMDDIAKHLAVSKKTIYQFYANKNDLVETMMTRELNEHTCDFQKMADASANVIEEVFAIMKHMGVMFSQMNPNLFYDMQKYHSTSWKLFKNFKEEYIERMVEESINKGIAQGLVRTDIQPKIIARLRMKELEMGFDPEVFPPDKYKMVDVQVALIDHFLHGICTLKGHKMINKYKAIIEEE